MIKLPLYIIILTLFASVNSYAKDETTVIKMDAIPGLRFDIKTFYVKPKSQVEIVIRNKDEMLHNLVITKPDKRESIVEAALKMGAGGPAENYIPDSSDVLWATTVIGLDSTVTLKFTAPDVPGNYPFVCTYPGHGYVMFGTMVVTNKLQPIEENTDAPASIHDHLANAEPLKTPSVRRFFLPDTGPASIAVALPGKQSYVWDAGACRFRYAWNGGFIKDLHNLPQQLPKSPAELDGEIFYKETTHCPIRLSLNPKEIPQWKFLGYQLDKEGYPEFHYMINGIEIKESVEINGQVISRHFKTIGAKKLWFHFDPKVKGRISSSGKKLAHAFEYTSTQAKNFTVRIGH